MCGRFTLATPADALQRHFDLFSIPEVSPHYNITPGQRIGVVLQENDHREMRPMKWGLVPRWAKDPSIGNKLANARAETAWEKPSFKHAFARRRGLVPADGYYEWQKVAGGKQPWFFHMDGRPFALAALWERWEGDGETLTTCALLTTEPNTLAATVHDRMPVILPEAAWATWLDPRAELSALVALMGPLDGDALHAHKVSKRVNTPTEDDASLTAPV